MKIRAVKPIYTMRFYQPTSTAKRRYTLHMPFLLLCLYASAGLAQTKPVQYCLLTGQLPRPMKGKAYLLDGQEQLVDSVIITKNRFAFKRRLAEPSLYNLRLDTASRLYPVFLEATPIQVTFRGDEYVVTGAKLHTLWKQYDDFTNTTRSQLIDLHQARKVAEQKGDTVLLNQLWKQNTVVSLAYGRGLHKIMRQKPYTFLNLYVLKNFGAGDSVIDTLLNAFRPQLAHYPTFKALEQGLIERTAQEQHTAVGKKAALFTFPDNANRMVSLDSLLKSKKLVLIDFWASWCGPCLKGLPALKKLHSQYADQGLEIISVSIDEDAAQWQKALVRYNPAGLQLLAGNDSQVKANYAISSIPRTFLVDQQGIIVGRSLSDEELTKRVAKLLQEKP